MIMETSSANILAILGARKISDNPLITIATGAGTTATIAYFSKKKNRKKVIVAGTTVTLLSLISISIIEGLGSSNQLGTKIENDNTPQQSDNTPTDNAVKDILTPVELSENEKIKKVVAEKNIDELVYDAQLINEPPDFKVFLVPRVSGISAIILDASSRTNFEDAVNTLVQNHDGIGFVLRWLVRDDDPFELVFSLCKILKNAGVVTFFIDAESNEQRFLCD